MGREHGRETPYRVVDSAWTPEHVTWRVSVVKPEVSCSSQAFDPPELALPKRRTQGNWRCQISSLRSETEEVVARPGHFR